MAGIAQLIQRRRILQRRAAEIALEIEAIDRVIFPRIEALASAAEGLSEPIELHVQALTIASAQGTAPVSTGKAEASDRARGYVNGGSVRISSRVELRPSGCPVDEPESPDWISSVVTILTARQGEPMRIADIYRELLARGKLIGGKNPMNNLSAHLSNRTMFISTPNGWTLRNPTLCFPHHGVSEPPGFRKEGQRSDD